MRALGVLLLAWGLMSQARADTLRLVTGNYPPYEYLENGRPRGLSVELLEEAFRRCHRAIHIEILPWARALAETRSGHADAVFSTLKTPEREAELIFSDETLVALDSSLFIRHGAPVAYRGDLAALKGYAIGILNGTSSGPAFDAAVTSGALPHVDRANDTETNIRKLLAGRIDLMASDRYVALYYLRRAGLADRVEELAPPLQRDQSYLAFHRDARLFAVRSDVDSALAAMKKDGSYQRIVERYAH